MNFREQNPLIITDFINFFKIELWFLGLNWDKVTTFMAVTGRSEFVFARLCFEGLREFGEDFIDVLELLDEFLVMGFALTTWSRLNDRRHAVEHFLFVFFLPVGQNVAIFLDKSQVMSRFLICPLKSTTFCILILFWTTNIRGCIFCLNWRVGFGFGFCHRFKRDNRLNVWNKQRDVESEGAVGIFYLINISNSNPFQYILKPVD